MKYLFLIFLIVASARDSNTGSVPDGFDKDASGIQIEVSNISGESAKSLFRKLSQQSQIPFKYPIDGCYARATEMARIAQQEGVEMGKIFAEGFLRVKTDLQSYPKVEWAWHVAPIAYVDGQNGKELMVFDPSLFNKPVPVQEWREKMLAPGVPSPHVDVLYFSSKYQYAPRSAENKKDGWNQDDLAGTASTMKNYKRYESFYSYDSQAPYSDHQRQLLNGGLSQ